MDMKKPQIETVDSLDDLCHDAGVPLPQSNEGIMLVVCSPTGEIRAHVLKHGILTEGRLEANRMVLFRACMEARAKAANEYMRAERAARSNVNV